MRASGGADGGAAAASPGGEQAPQPRCAPLPPAGMDHPSCIGFEWHPGTVQASAPRLAMAAPPPGTAARASQPDSSGPPNAPQKCRIYSSWNDATCEYKMWPATYQAWAKMGQRQGCQGSAGVGQQHAAGRTREEPPPAPAPDACCPVGPSPLPAQTSAPGGATTDGRRLDIRPQAPCINMTVLPGRWRQQGCAATRRGQLQRGLSSFSP